MDNKPKVYIPKNALINIENKALEPPKTRYEKRRRILNLEDVKKVVKGRYGKED
jgi:hypothetical protein